MSYQKVPFVNKILGEMNYDILIAGKGPNVKSKQILG